MIECSEKNIYYIKRRRKRFRLRFILFFLAACSVFLYYKNVVETLIIDICMDKASALVVQSVNESVYDYIMENGYYDIVSIEKNSNGDITLITTNAFLVNEMNKKIAIKTDESLVHKLDKGIKIPFMAFTGIKFLSGYGFDVDLKVIAVSDVNCEFNDVFTSAGINQTMHSLYLTVKSNLVINVPTLRTSKEIDTEVLMGESVIVGKVPEIYLNGSK